MNDPHGQCYHEEKSRVYYVIKHAEANSRGYHEGQPDQDSVLSAPLAEFVSKVEGGKDLYEHEASDYHADLCAGDGYLLVVDLDG